MKIFAGSPGSRSSSGGKDGRSGNDGNTGKDARTGGADGERNVFVHKVILNRQNGSRNFALSSPRLKSWVHMLKLWLNHFSGFIFFKPGY